MDAGTNSYFGDKKIKSKFVKHMKAHREADQIIQRVGWDATRGKKGKGCFIGCLFHNYDHSLFRKELGAPEWLGHLADTIFEGLSQEDAVTFAVDVLEAIPVGANVEQVKWKFCASILKENTERALRLDISDDLKKQVVDAISKCLDVHERAIESGEWNKSQAEFARLAAKSAWSAARCGAAWSLLSAWSALESAGSAARSAEWSNSESAESASESARFAAMSAELAVMSAAYARYRDELLRLLREAK